MNSVQRNSFLVVVLVCAVPVFGQTDQGILRFNLKEFPHDSADSGPPETLPVFVEIATFQPNAAQGIVFTLNIENNSTETIRIVDPIDTARIGLTGFTRPFSKGMRNIDPDFAMCISRPVSSEQVKTMSDDKKTRRPFQAFDVDRGPRNQRLKTVSDIVPWEPLAHMPSSAPQRTTPLSDSDIFEFKFGGKLTLEPGQRFQAVLQVSRVYSDYEAFKKTRDQWLSEYMIPNGHGGTTAAGAPPRPEPEIIPIPSDKYYLSVSIILITDNKGTFTPSFDKSVIIQLGEPSSPVQQDAVTP